MLKTAVITRKGQITIPRNARSVLGTNIVEIEVRGETVVLKPVKSVAGALHEYARTFLSLREIRDQVWTDVVYGKKH